MSDDAKTRFKAFLNAAFITLQSILPTHLLSLLVFHLARIKVEGFKNALINGFIKAYRVDMSDAEFERVASYPDFNAFFTRALKKDARPLDPNAAALLSPVDGRVSEIGTIKGGTLIQAKGHDYTVSELLGASPATRLFQNGSFATLYLAPFNYHRIHMPANGRLREWIYQPGRLFSVSELSVSRMPRLFARNERIVAMFESDFGPLAVVMVGALFVGSIETTWAGQVTPPHGQKAGVYTPAGQVVLLRGREMGRFNMGSTVILLGAPRMITWHPQLKAGNPVRVGQAIGALRKIA